MSGNPRTLESRTDPTVHPPRRTSVSKKYLPKFASEQYALPSIDEFKLDRILSHELRAESHELANSLVRVSQNYQQDLRAEIRHKLSLEQKIQYKNIDVAKLAHALNKRILSRNKKFNKVSSRLDSNGNGHVHQDAKAVPNNLNHIGKPKENGISTDVSNILDLSSQTSELLNSLSFKLSQIDRLVHADSSSEILGSYGGDKNNSYPNLAKLLSKRVYSESPKHSPNIQKPRAVPHDDLHDEAAFNGHPTNPESETEAEPSNGESHIHEQSQTKPITPFKPGRSQDGSDKEDSPRNDPNATDVDMENPEIFESFMSETITKFRAQQDAKWSGEDDDWVFQISSQESKKHHGPFYQEIDSMGSKTANGSLNKRNTSSPINLLYSSVSKNNSPELCSLVLTPASGSTIKSVPTVESTPQVSHFKKLRINGSPITSATFAKGTSYTRPIYSPFQDGGTIVIDGVQGKLKKYEISSQESAFDQSSKSSPATKALESSLALDTSRITSESEDNWDSSALNTASDDEDTDHEFTTGGSEEPLLSTDSSDYDSSSSEERHNEDDQTIAADTNQYYSMLKDDLKSRKKKKQMHGKSKRNKCSRLKSSSPTPKFKPSHHTLKPKKSILKLPRTVPTLTKVKTCQAQVVTPVEPSIDGQLLHGSAATQNGSTEVTSSTGRAHSDQNIMSSKAGSSTINADVAIGTILKASHKSSLSAGGSQRPRSLDGTTTSKQVSKEIKSISNLKSFLDSAR